MAIAKPTRPKPPPKTKKPPIVMRDPHWTYKLYVLLLMGRIGGAERRGARVFMHMPTVATYLSIGRARINGYVEHGVNIAIFNNLKKRHRIWSFDIVLPSKEDLYE